MYLFEKKWDIYFPSKTNVDIQAWINKFKIEYRTFANENELYYKFEDNLTPLKSDLLKEIVNCWLWKTGISLKKDLSEKKELNKNYYFLQGVWDISNLFIVVSKKIIIEEIIKYFIWINPDYLKRNNKVDLSNISKGKLLNDSNLEFEEDIFSESTSWIEELTNTSEDIEALLTKMIEIEPESEELFDEDYINTALIKYKCNTEDFFNIWNYTTDNTYLELNLYFRKDWDEDANRMLNLNCERKDLEEYAEELKKSIKKLPVFWNKVYRLIRENNWQNKTFSALKEWDTYIEKWFMSTFQDLASLETFCHMYDVEKKDSIILEIDWFSWKDITYFSQNQRESEIIFPKDSSFKIESIKTDNNFKKIMYLKEIKLSENNNPKNIEQQESPNNIMKLVTNIWKLFKINPDKVIKSDKKIRVISDLHMEFTAGKFILDKSENEKNQILCIPWDLSFMGENEKALWSNFIAEVSNRFFKVLLVLWNHDYWHSDLNTIFDIKDLLPDNVHLLENESIIIDWIKFIWATLWTDFKDLKTKKLDFSSMNNYDNWMNAKLIKKSWNPINSKILIDKNTFSHKYIFSELDKYKGPCVVLTHHAPSYKSLTKMLEEYIPYTNHYCNDLDEEIMKRKNIKYWLHWHLHTSKQYKIWNTLVVSNANGNYDDVELGVENKDFKNIKLLDM